jgi:hypothetical protein
MLTSFGSGFLQTAEKGWREVVATESLQKGYEKVKRILERRALFFFA